MTPSTDREKIEAVARLRAASEASKPFHPQESALVLKSDLRAAIEALSQGWRSDIENAPRDGTAINVLVRGRHPRRPRANGHFVTTARWVWSDNKCGEQGDRHPLEGGFLELNNDWSSDWGGNLGPVAWQPLPAPPTEEKP